VSIEDFFGADELLSDTDSSSLPPLYHLEPVESWANKVCGPDHLFDYDKDFHKLTIGTTYEDGYITPLFDYDKDFLELTMDTANDQNDFIPLFYYDMDFPELSMATTYDPIDPTTQVTIRDLLPQ